MRQDVFVFNDSGGMSLLSSSVVERVIEDARRNDERFVDAHEVLLGGLSGDASFVARVVVDEPLSADEQEQWIARYRSALHVPCGRLLICGGFDPDVLGEWLDEGEAELVREVAVPPGHYLVDVHTYLHTMNGRVILGDVWDEALGAWFRRDHPGQPFPSWVAGELHRFPEGDPGHEHEWAALEESVESGALAIDLETLDWIGFLFHLQPFDANARLSTPDDGPWFGPTQGLRRPERLPLGVPSTVKDREYRAALAELIGEDDEGQSTFVVVPLDVFAQAGEYPLTPIADGPVEISPRHLPRLHRLAWFISTPAPEIRVECEGAASLARLFDGWAGYGVRVEDGVLRIGFPETGRFGVIEALETAPADTWTQFPPGSVLELVTASMDEEESVIGGTRFRGVIVGAADAPVWRIAESYPPVSAGRLRDALALAEAAENGRTLELASPAEAAEVLERFEKTWGDMLTRDNPLTCDGARLTLHARAVSTLYLIAAEAFRLRYADTWPCPEDDFF